MALDEERSLLLQHESISHKNDLEEKVSKPYNLTGVMLASTGVFISGIDQSFITASYADIASSMKELNNAPLLLSAYNLGYCTALPIYGKLSDSWGRKGPLIGAYLIFGAGCLLSGLSSYFWQIIIGRAITGIGAAGLVSLVSVVITDSVPPNEVASVRSYVDIVSVLGRCSGGVLGACILEVFGWKWSFMVQVPLALLCSLASYTLMPKCKHEKLSEDKYSLVKNFDVLGLILFIFAIGTFLRATSPQIPDYDSYRESSFSIISLVSCLLGLLFLAIEFFLAKCPFLPLNQLGGTINVFLVSQIILFFAHETHITNLAPYFLYAEGFKATTTALLLILSSIGFSTGSFIGGYAIKWSHRMKALSILGLSLGILIYFLIALQWTSGARVYEALYTFLAGFAHGMLHSAMFGALAACCSKSMVASSITSFHLCQQVGSILGTGISTAALQGIFRASLSRDLPNNPQKYHIIQGVLKDINFFKTLPLELQDLIRGLFLKSFKKIAYIAMGTACLALPPLLMNTDKIMK